ncbi:MAG: hypothetical protein ACR2OR_17425 [Hyphomicrobiales bacterium]
MTGDRIVSDKTHHGASGQSRPAAEEVPVSFETLVERVNELSWRVKRSEDQVSRLAELESSMSVLLEKMQTNIAAPVVTAASAENPAVAPIATNPPPVDDEANPKRDAALLGNSAFTPALVGIGAFFAAAAIAAAGYFAYAKFSGSDNKAEAKTGSVVEKPEKISAKSKSEQPEDAKQSDAASKLSTGSVEKK